MEKAVLRYKKIIRLAVMQEEKSFHKAVFRPQILAVIAVKTYAVSWGRAFVGLWKAGMTVYKWAKRKSERIFVYLI